jgi:hypothetical protein
MDRRARGGCALVGRDVGVERDPFELAHVEVELLGRDLKETGGVALAELALAEIDRRGVVGMHRDPRIDGVRIGRAGDVAARGRRRTSGTADAEANDEGAAALNEAATRQRAERGVGEDVGHRAPPAIVVDAVLIACMTRG